MRRRDFITVLGGAAATWPWPGVSRAENLGKLPTIGFLGVDPAMWSAWTGAFVSRLTALGWIDGRTVNLVFRWSRGRPELHAQYATEFAQLNVNVIVTSGAAVHALMQATSSIPIVFAVANDPLGAGMVKSLSRPGVNATGISAQNFDTAGKRFELLRETVPGLRRLAVMADATFPQAMLEIGIVRELARNFDIQVLPIEIRRTDDIAPAFEKMEADKPEALYVVINELLNANRILIITSAQAAKMPTIFGTRDWVLSGGLMSYGPDLRVLFARAAEITDRILKGEKAEDIPVEQPTRFQLVLNLKTSNTIGLTIPPIILARADEVIE
jgi:putative tryptophan/tyrosine transport system substrate-binding protein